MRALPPKEQVGHICPIVHLCYNFFMIINSSNPDKKVSHLAKSAAELILSGVKTENILILTLNSFKKEKISQKTYDILFSKGYRGFGTLNISTFSGLAYNSVSKNWITVEKIISPSGGETTVYPTLCGLDASQYFLRKIIKEEEFEDYFSKKNLMHQILRRYKLIVENSLSEAEIAEKSAVLNETFAQNTHNAINKYKNISSKNRFFDNLKQTASFMYLLKNGKINDFDNIEYFFADDVDEYSFSAFEFCKYMLSKAKECSFYMDKDGCTRNGYLCGYSGIYEDLKQLRQKEINIDDNNPLSFDAKTLYSNMTSNQKEELSGFETFAYSKRLEMLEAASSKINKLLSDGVPVEKIHIITPVIDETLIYSFKNFLKSRNINIQLLTGNKKIIDDPYVYATITILELLNPGWGIIPNTIDIRILLNEILKIPVYSLKEYISYYEKHFKLPDNIKCSAEYTSLIKLINNEDLKNKPLLKQYEEIFAQIIAPNMNLGADYEPLTLFLKSLQEFEKIKENFSKYDGITLTPADWLMHIKNSVVSQNPSKPAHIEKNSLVISTAQKIVDFSLNSDYQIWLDTTSPEWIKEDTGTIYNSWVFQKNFNEKEFTPDMNKKFTLEKTAKLLRKLLLCSNKKIFTFSSTYDSSGRENNGELADFIYTNDEPPQKFNFIPRDDQKEILNYNGGKLAVPAVPGAGKTTIMLALLLKLVENGTQPDSILVLTYMESAARNFLNRYKKITKTKNRLPHISTIHAFAYKILTENNNYAKANLPEDFSVCDDGIKTAIMRDICSRNIPIGENIEDYSSLMLSAVSKAKINRISNSGLCTDNDNHFREFSNIYKMYQNRLKELSLLDYDDLLVHAVNLLTNNTEIAQYYRKKFLYIIEDEAQDSSSIQQELLKILSEENSNLIRCGDVNQAILGTFSNSDVKGFKQFINDNKKVEMFRSQRCSKPIYTLANNLVEYAVDNPVSKDAFYNLKMQEVKGKNPDYIKIPEYKAFNTQTDEKEFVINDIKSKLKDIDNLPTIAILLRTNKQVAIWASFMEKHGLNVMCRGDSYKQKRIFSFLYSVIELFAKPWDNKLSANLYKEFCNIEKFSFKEEIYNFLEKNPNPVMHPDFIKNKTFPDRDLEDFWWEAFSIIEGKTFDLQEIVISCADKYFDDVIDKSNAYLFSILLKRYTNTLTGSDEKFKLNYVPEILRYFKNLISSKNLRGISFFAKEDEDDSLNGFVQIMTVHKAKGAEFDYVYMPEFTDYNFAVNFSALCEKIQKRRKTLLTKLDKIISGKEQPVSGTAKAEINETLRLIYVAITRAKKELTFSYSLKSEFRKDNTPVELLENLLSPDTKTV